MKILSESLDSYLESYNYDREQLTSLVYENLLERYRVILTAVSNGFLSEDVVNDNIQTVRNMIEETIVPEIEEYCDIHETQDPLNFSTFLYKLPGYKDVVKTLHEMFSNYDTMQNEVWESELSFLGENKATYKEGIFSNLISMFTDMPKFPKNIETELDVYIEPYGLPDLYKMIVGQLKHSSNNAVKDEIMPIFFPDKIDKKNPPSTVVMDYKEKMEDVLIDFIVNHGKEIIEKTFEGYKERNPKIPEEEYYGRTAVASIINQIKENNYKLEEELINIYEEYKSADKTSEDSTKSTKPKDLTYKDLNDEQKEIYDSLKELTSADKQDLINIVSRIDAADREEAVLKTLQQLNDYISI